MINFIHHNKGFWLFWGELQSIFCKNLTEFYQISLKNLPHLTDFSPQLMACVNMIHCSGLYSIWLIHYMRCLMTKPTKWPVHPAKTQISLAICPVWSESSLSIWRNIGPLITYWGHSEWRLWSDWTDGQADLILRWAHLSFCLLCRVVAQMNKKMCMKQQVNRHLP